jgi:hypothetical protein
LRKGVTMGCVGALLGCSVGTALGEVRYERDPGRQMVASRATDGTLTIDTGNANDDIEISRKGRVLRVTVNGSSRDFAVRDAEQIAIRANGGDDTIRVRPGTDMRGISLQIDGGEGNDTIIGSDGHDVLIGGPGDDVIHGRKGNDLILGGEGNDRLYGEEGRDIIIGGAGNDHIDGGAGHDFLHGGPGENEVIAGTDTKNTIVGEPTGNAGHTIIIRGSPEFIAETQAALDVLRSTPTGRAILETIDASGHQVVIVEVMEPNATAAEVDSKPQNLRRDGSRGAGTDATITWNPRFRGEASGPAWAYTPPVIILGHELVHAFNMVTGTMIPNDMPMGPDSRTPPASEELAVGLNFDHDVNPRTRRISVERFYQRLGLPVVSENLLRQELGWPKRLHY